jgi:parallel beta-helix repeat protein
MNRLRERARGLVVVTLALSVVAVAAFAAPASAAAAVLYVDRNNAGCSNAGPGSAAVPYCSISTAAAKAVAGQTVEVASGTYAERVVTKRSGAPGSPIVYRTAPDATVTVVGQANGFYVSGKSWVSVRGFRVTGTTGPGIKVSSSSNIEISGTEVSYAGQPVADLVAKGIYLSGVTNAVVSGNTTHHNTDAGIWVGSTSTGIRVTGNVSYANARGYTRAAAGIDVRTSAGSVVEGNTCYGNEDSGINIWTSSHNSVVVNNVVYANGDHGIDVHSTNDTQVVSNTVYRNVDSGIEATGSLRSRFTNNISVDNGINSPRTSGNIRADKASAATTVTDHNLLFLSAPSKMVDWGGKAYPSIAAFTAATGQEAHGIQADPAFVDPAGADFRLTAGSPAADSADSGAPGQPLTDLAGNPRVDLTAVADAGTGPRSYDDRGAYELQS